MIDVLVAQRETLVDEVGRNEAAPRKLDTTGIDVVCLEPVDSIGPTNG